MPVRLQLRTVVEVTEFGKELGQPQAGELALRCTSPVLIGAADRPSCGTPPSWKRISRCSSENTGDDSGMVPPGPNTVTSRAQTEWLGDRPMFVGDRRVGGSMSSRSILSLSTRRVIPRSAAAWV